MSLQPPEPDELKLLEALRAPNIDLRDPREIATLVQRARKPLLLIDETREKDLVIWSCVAVDGRTAWDINMRMDAAIQRAPFLRETSGTALLTETGAAVTQYRQLIEEALRSAHVLRAGITFDSLRAWRRKTRFGLTTVHTGLRLDKGEFAAIVSVIGAVAERMNLRGLVVAVVDSAMQNGLDPSQLKLAADEHGTILIDDQEQPLLLWPSTPEWRDVGALLDVPDFDAARSRSAPEYDRFLEQVRTAPVGDVIYWPRAQ